MELIRGPFNTKKKGKINVENFSKHGSRVESSLIGLSQ